MATDRPYGRIRVRRDQAAVYFRLIREERARVLLERRLYRQIDIELRSFQQIVALLDSMTDELERLRVEMDWGNYLDGEE